MSIDRTPRGEYIERYRRLQWIIRIAIHWSLPVLILLKQNDRILYFKQKVNYGGNKLNAAIFDHSCVSWMVRGRVSLRRLFTTSSAFSIVNMIPPPLNGNPSTAAVLPGAWAPFAVAGARNAERRSEAWVKQISLADMEFLSHAVWHAAGKDSYTAALRELLNVFWYLLEAACQTYRDSHRTL